jgi:predicted MFS family arabinose efflux permease
MTTDARQRDGIAPLLGIGVATAAAHIGNNFTTYLIGGLIDRYGFSPIRMGAWSMAETLAYAAAMFLVAPRVGRLSPRTMLVVASILIVVAQLGSAGTSSYPLLLGGRIATGLGFGLANTALNLAAARTAHPARAISIGIACQTVLYALINIVLPLIGARWGVSSMFVALGILSAAFALAASLLPKARMSPGGIGEAVHAPIGVDGARVLAAMALFTFGSLAIWPFMERAAHAIAIPATQFGRYQSLATLASAFGNLALAIWVARMRRMAPLALALISCGLASALLTTTGSAFGFATALILYNASWFVTYPLLLGIGYAVDPGGRLAVLCSAVWLAMMSLGSLVTGSIAQVFGGYTAVGPMGLAFCLAALALIWPLARRMDAAHPQPLRNARPSTAG